MGVSVHEFIHPADEQARRQLESVPGFSTAMKAFLRIGPEQLFHGLNMANQVRLGPNQLPELYRKLPPICRRLGIEEPEFYLEMNPAPNAHTFGDSRTLLTVTSGLLEHMDDDEVESVIAHECGHIACRHVLYHTMARLLLQGAAMFQMTAIFTTPVRLALLYWIRRSELSADRASAVAASSAKPVVESMIRLAGGPKRLTGGIDVDAYAAQADAYDDLLEGKWDRLLQGAVAMQQTHPFTAVRVREIRQWAVGEDFERLAADARERAAAPACPQCGHAREAAWQFCQTCGAKLD